MGLVLAFLYFSVAMTCIVITSALVVLSVVAGAAQALDTLWLYPMALDAWRGLSILWNLVWAFFRW